MTIELLDVLDTVCVARVWKDLYLPFGLPEAYSGAMPSLHEATYSLP